jgi:hypothetical protein
VREQKIKLRHGDTLIINTMEGNCMMNFFKRFVAGGFQVRQHSDCCRAHVLSCLLVATLFGVVWRL